MNKSLTQAEFDRIMAKTSPHSLAHNIEALHVFKDVVVNTEPTLDPTLLGESSHEALLSIQRVLVKTAQDTPYLRDRALGVGSKIESDEDVLTDIGIMLAKLIILARSSGLGFGIPMDDVTEAVIAAMLDDRDPGPVVKTMMFGVRNPRHPYENADRDA